MKEKIYLLKKRVYEANMYLFNEKLIIDTWGNASERICVNNDIYICIKPSGVPYAEMTPADMVVIDGEGVVLDGNLVPSSDTETHLEIYRNFNSVNGIAHTHSIYATMWAQSGRSIPIYGTTHADYACDEIPCTEVMHENDVIVSYEHNTGKYISKKMKEFKELPKMVLVNNHAPFTMGLNAAEAVKYSLYLEVIAKMALGTEMLHPDAKNINKFIKDKHYYRKHGANSYYGQNSK